MRISRWSTVAVGLLVLALVPVWGAYGALTPGGDHGAMEVDLEAFLRRSQGYAAEHSLADGSVQAVEGRPIPVTVMQFGYLPGVLRLRTGETYTLELVAQDVAHGFSLQMGSSSLNAVLMPGMMTMLELTPTQPGEYLIICNEYCGIGHQFMKSKLVVEEASGAPPAPAQPGDHRGGH